jgi:hypothetical protein
MRPIIPFVIERWRKGRVANTAATITTIAPIRSDHGARLKNSHHTMIASVPASAAIMPANPVSGKIAGIRILSPTITAAATTPGHNRSGVGRFVGGDCSSIAFTPI